MLHQHKANERKLEEMRKEKLIKDELNEMKDATFKPKVNKYYTSFEHDTLVRRSIQDVDKQYLSPKRTKAATLTSDQIECMMNLREKPEINRHSNQISV